MKKLFLCLILLGTVCGACLHLTGCTLQYQYSNETDPQKYLSFSLLDDGTYTVDGFAENKVKDLVIPATYNGVAVTAISKNAFYEEPYWNPFRDAVKTLTIEPGIAVIQPYAFYCCMFEQVTLPNTIEVIGDYAFEGVGASMQLPSSVKEIGDCAFRSTGLCGKLDLTNISYGTEAFRGSDIESLILPEGITSVGGFSNCENLKYIQFPSTLTQINSSAFSGSALERIELPSGVEEIGSHAFSGSALERIELPSGVKEIGSHAFSSCFALKEIILSGLNYAEVWAFENCTALRKLVLRDLQAQIDPSAFYGSTLDEIEIEGTNEIYTLKEGCLTYKNDPEVLILGTNRVTEITNWDSIGWRAFSGRILGDLTIGGQVNRIDPDAFQDAVIGNVDITFSKIDALFDYAEIQNLTITATEIMPDAFRRCKINGTVTINEGCKTIGESAFGGCDGITSVYLPSTIEEVGIGAFGFCENLKSVYYDYHGDKPARLNSTMFFGSGCEYNDQASRFEITMTDGFQFYVREDVFEICKAQWTDKRAFQYSSNQFTYLCLQSLSEFLAVY